MQESRQGFASDAGESWIPTEGCVQNVEKGRGRSTGWIGSFIEAVESAHIAEQKESLVPKGPARNAEHGLRTQMKSTEKRTEKSATKGRMPITGSITEKEKRKGFV